MTDVVRKHTNLIFLSECSSFTFDYLYDHIAIKPEECVQQNHNYAIIDKLDSILIDDADEPHIIGGGNSYNAGNIFKENYPLIVELIGYKDSKLYEIDRLGKTAWFTQEGKQWLSSKKSIPDLFSVGRTYEIKDFDTLSQDKQAEVLNRIYLQNVFLPITSCIDDIRTRCLLYR